MMLRRLDDRGIAYAVHGEEGEQAVLALHSLGTDHRLWDGVAARLSRAGYRVLVPDSRGHGASDDGPLPDAGAWVDDLLAVLDRESVAAAHVLGVSMGCAQALELALQRPERVRSLVLTGGFGHLDDEVAAQKASGLSDGATAAGMQAWARQYASDTLITDAPEAHRLVAEAVASVPLDAYTAAAHACFAARSGPLRSVEVPTLVVWGEADHKTPEELSLGLVDDLPHARLHRLPGGGHLAPLDVPDAFAEVVVEFLTTDDSQRASRRRARMIYELHTYVSADGRIDELHRRFEERTLDIFARLGIEVVGFFQDRHDPTRLHYLTRFEDEQARDRAWAAFKNDPEWRDVKAASEVDGPLIAEKHELVLEPTSYSPAL